MGFMTGPATQPSKSIVRSGTVYNRVGGLAQGDSE